MNYNKVLTIYFLILFVLINCSNAILLKNKNSKSFLESKQEPDIHNIVIFGNIGEIDYFKNSTIASSKIDEQDREEYYEKNVFTQKYKTDDLSCDVTDKDSTSTDLLKEKGLTNFEKILLSKDALGFVKRSDEILFLGDIVNPEYRELTYKNSGKINSDNVDFYEFRIKCGWNIFINTLKKANLAQILFNKKKQKISLSDKIIFNKGKFSQLINRDLEDSIIETFDSFKDQKVGHDGKVKAEAFLDSEIPNMSNSTLNQFKRASSGKTPIITTIVYQEFTLQIIDFDSNILSCLSQENEIDYMICSKKRSFSFMSFQDASKYALRLDRILNQKVLKNEVGKKVWRIMRSYHPPIHSLGKPRFFFFKNFTVESNGKTFKFNLWESIKRNFIQIFFSAYDNNASVNIIPYTINNFVKTEFNCFRNKIEDAGCYFYLKNDDQIEYSEAPLTRKDCDNNLFYKLPYISDSNKIEENFMYVFNVGHSGTTLEKLEYGYTSNAFLFWARAQKDLVSQEYIKGFSYISFTKDQVEVNFLETYIDNENKTSKTYRAATFRVTESPIPDQNKLNQYIKNSICKDYLVVSRKGYI